jgi:hypothetical protein
MKLISIIKNNLTNTDLAVYFKDNYPHDTDGPSSSPLPPRNSTRITHTKSGVPMLQIEFWRNAKFQKYFWFGEKVWFEAEDQTDFIKNGRQWSEFLEIYSGF